MMNVANEVDNRKRSIGSLFAIVIAVLATAAPAGAAEAVRPFTIDVPDAVLDDLNTRLSQTRFADRVAGSHPLLVFSRVFSKLNSPKSDAGLAARLMECERPVPANR